MGAVTPLVEATVTALAEATPLAEATATALAKAGIGAPVITLCHTEGMKTEPRQA